MSEQGLLLLLVVVLSTLAGLLVTVLVFTIVAAKYSPPDPSPEFAINDEEANRLSEHIRTEYGQTIQPHPSNDGILNENVTSAKILKALAKVKSTAPGEDGLYYRHITNLPQRALDYLAKIYSTCIQCSYFPVLWKKGKVKLLPKPNKARDNPRNYRPITLLPVLGKTLERILNEDLVTYLEGNEIIPESQAGYRRNRSTQDQLFQLIQDATDGFQNDEYTMATLHDIEKAYDKIWHEGLTLKLKRVGLDDRTVAMLQNYLTDREVRLTVGETVSEPVKLLAGTPQGSVLSPTLFNVWVSDIPQPTNDHTKLSQFADDTATWSRGKKLKKVLQALQKLNNRLIGWCKIWRIKLSPSKTQFIIFHRKHVRKRDLFIKIDGFDVRPSENVEFLGVILDSKLTLKKHQEKINTELKRRTGVLCQIAGTQYKPRANSELSLKIFQSIIVPVTTYAASATCIRQDNYFRQQDDLIRKAAKIALHAPDSARNEYVEREAKLVKSKLLTLKLAKNYLWDEKRSKPVKDTILAAVRIPTQQGVKTPVSNLPNLWTGNRILI